MAKDFVITKDGRIAFRRDEFKLMTKEDPSMFNSNYELVLWTTSYPTGRITRFDTKIARDEVAKEILEQLD